MKLIKILSDKVQIRTDQQEFSNVRINDLISITDGTAELVTMVTAVTDNDAEVRYSDDDFILGGASIKVWSARLLGVSIMEDSVRLWISILQQISPPVRLMEKSFQR